MRSLRQQLWCHYYISIETKLRMCQASVLSVLLYGSECLPISTSLCSRLSVFDMHAQWTNVKWFDYKTNIEVRSLTKCQPIQRCSTKSPPLVWPSTPVSTQPSCPLHLHLQPECRGMVETLWSPAHAMGRRPRQTPQTAGDNIDGGLQHLPRPCPLEVNHCSSCRL